jgi:hypothetical protein
MPAIAGQVVILTVSDVDRSTDGHCRLLGMEGPGLIIPTIPG